LFVASGTMGNTIGIKLLTKHGEEVICDSRAHLFDWELSMSSWFSGCQMRSAETEDGILTWDIVQKVYRPGSAFGARTGAIELENTFNMSGGRVYPQKVLDEVCDRAHERGVNVHLDGARIFNAAAATGETVARIAAKADTVMFCLSKALGAPVGSIVAGPRALIEEGRLLRKRLGGAMRQAGVLAAAGLIALEEMPRGLAQDHRNARFLAEGLAEIPGISIDPKTVDTNIVIFDISGTGLAPREISAKLKERGVLINGVRDRHMRAVTHYDVDRAACEEALRVMAATLGTSVYRGTAAL